MNTRYTETFLFLSRLSRRSNKGFALGFVLTAGVLMAATGAVMLLRSSSETEKIVAQEATAKGKTTGEVAIARIQYLLGKYPFLAEMEMEDWQNADVESKLEAQIRNTCEGQSLTQSEIDAKVDEVKQEIGKYTEKDGTDYKWLKMDESNPNQGQFRFTTFQPAIAGQEMGTLTIEAKANVDNDLKEAPTRLEVKIPLSENEVEIEAGDSPGLWVQNGSGLDDIVAAHVWIGSGGDDCSVTDDAAKVAEINTKVFGSGGGLAEAIKDGELPSGTTFKLAQVAEYKFPDEKTLQETYKKQITDVGVTPIDITSALASNPNDSPLSTIANRMNEFVDKAFNNIFGGVALANNGNGNGNGNGNNNGNGNGNNNGNKTSVTEPIIDTVEDTVDTVEDLLNPNNDTNTNNSGGGGSSGSCGTQVDASKNGSTLVFPRAGDTPTRTQELDDGTTLCIYDYKVNKSLGGVQTAIRTVNAQGNRQRVIFHLYGDIDKNTEVSHIGDEDINGIKQAFKMPDCTGSCKPVDFQVWGHDTTSVCMNGNKKFHAFLWAPKADLGMMGGGGGKGGLNGVAFIKTWNQTCGSNSKSGAHVVQTGDWLDLGIETPEPTPPMTVGQPANVKTIEYHSSDPD